MRFKRPRVKKRPHRINREIRAREVRLIDEEKNQIGIVPIQKALQAAEEKDLDLVEISPNANPPVCRILDYGKYLYSLQKKAHEAQRQQKKMRKELRVEVTKRTVKESRAKICQERILSPGD